MFVIAGRLHVDPAARSAFLDGCADVVRTARASAGCLDFSLSADLLDPSRVDMYERWESDEALQAFRSSGADLPDGIVDGDVHKFRISSVEAP